MSLQTAETLPLPGAKDEEGAYVIDPTVSPNGPARTHEQLWSDGRIEQYTFEFQKPLLVPLSHALRFLENGFKVFVDEQCTRALKQTRSARDGHSGHVVQQLAEDEVIANLEELTAPALYKRAVTLPGGDAFKPNSKKADLVEFVSAFNQRNADAKRRVEVDDLPEGGGMSPAEVAAANEEFAD